MIKKIFLFFFLFSFNSHSYASVENKIINNFKKINNISFDFKQIINEKTEEGNCVIQYPKKIYCEYDSSNKKILVSNGKSLVIKSKTSYYLYPLKSTPLNLILDKDFLLQKISIMEEKLINEEFINYKFVEDNNEINIFFSRKNYNLIGWQTIDIYQNLNNTYLSSITKNQKLKKNLFKLPAQN